MAENSHIYQHIARCYLSSIFPDLDLYGNGTQCNLYFARTAQSYKLSSTSTGWVLYKRDGPIASGRLDVLLVYLKGLEETADGRM